MDPDAVDPDDFIRWAFAKALAHRQPRYAKMARNWGITVPMSAVQKVHDGQGFIDMIADALETQR